MQGPSSKQAEVACRRAPRACVAATREMLELASGASKRRRLDDAGAASAGHSGSPAEPCPQRTASREGHGGGGRDKRSVLARRGSIMTWIGKQFSLSIETAIAFWDEETREKAYAAPQRLPQPLYGMGPGQEAQLVVHDGITLRRKEERHWRLYGCTALARQLSLSKGDRVMLREGPDGRLVVARLYAPWEEEVQQQVQSKQTTVAGTASGTGQQPSGTAGGERRGTATGAAGQAPALLEAAARDSSVAHERTPMGPGVGAAGARSEGFEPAASQGSHGGDCGGGEAAAYCVGDGEGPHALADDREESGGGAGDSAAPGVAVAEPRGEPATTAGAHAGPGACPAPCGWEYGVGPGGPLHAAVRSAAQGQAAASLSERADTGARPAASQTVGQGRAVDPRLRAVAGVAPPLSEGYSGGGEARACGAAADWATAPTPRPVVPAVAAAPYSSDTTTKGDAEPPQVAATSPAPDNEAVQGTGGAGAEEEHAAAYLPVAADAAAAAAPAAASMGEAQAPETAAAAGGCGLEDSGVDLGRMAADMAAGMVAALTAAWRAETERAAVRLSALRAEAAAARQRERTAVEERNRAHARERAALDERETAEQRARDAGAERDQAQERERAAVQASEVAQAAQAREAEARLAAEEAGREAEERRDAARREAEAACGARQEAEQRHAADLAASGEREAALQQELAAARAHLSEARSDLEAGAAREAALRQQLAAAQSELEGVRPELADLRAMRAAMAGVLNAHGSRAGG